MGLLKRNREAVAASPEALTSPSAGSTYALMSALGDGKRAMAGRGKGVSQRRKKHPGILHGSCLYPALSRAMPVECGLAG